MSALDHPVWNSLSERHLALSVGDALARRYDPDINVFAAACDDSLDALEALSDLPETGEMIFLLQVGEITYPSGFEVLKSGPGVQMVAETPIETIDGPDVIVRLGDAHAADMLALAALTEPGPFLAETHKMGRFWGVVRDGRLAAMAGERFQPPGFTELSGVCTHPDFEGEGLGKRLSAHVAHDIQARGETPFLHAWSSNNRAIGLYERLGFKARAAVKAVALRRL